MARGCGYVLMYIIMAPIVVGAIGLVLLPINWVIGQLGLSTSPIGVAILIAAGLLAAFGLAAIFSRR